MNRTLIIVSLLALSVSAAAATTRKPLDRLAYFLADTHTLKADFTQEVTQATLPGATQSSGTVLIKRPNRFRWNYIKPDKQIIVADGEQVWVYDAGLEQVTVKPLKTTLASSPSMLLSGKGSIRDAFNVVKQGQKHDLAWVTLKPKSDHAQFSKIRIGLNAQTIHVMELTGANLGQVTRITFTNVKRNPPVADSVFEFTPPKGADVIHAPH